MAALHELRDKGLIEGRGGYYDRYSSSAHEWFAVGPWPLLWCSAPKVPKEPKEKEEREKTYDGGVPWSMREKAKEFVPVDGEPEEDTGLVDRSPTSVGKGQRRLEG